MGDRKDTTRATAFHVVPLGLKKDQQRAYFEAQDEEGHDEEERLVALSNGMLFFPFALIQSSLILHDLT